MAEIQKPLTPEQRRAIVALLSAKNVADAAKVSGVGERSLHRWLDDPCFTAELHAAQADVLQTATRRLSHAMSLAADAVIDTLEHGDTRALKLKAAALLIGALPTLREMVDFEARVAALEAMK